MEDPTEKEIQKIKDILEKDQGREVSWEEATKTMWDIKNLARIMYEITSNEIQRQEILKENPSGFHLEDGGTCSICNEYAPRENSWYDKYGLKCMPCQKAINAKIIPVSVIKDKESWYSKQDLASYFNIKGADLNRLIKESFLKDRIIPGATKKVHFQIFLIKENRDVLPPKKYLKSRIVKVMHKEEEYFTTEPWYMFADEKLIKRLSKYKILYLLPEMLSKPTDSDRLLYKQPNSLFEMK